MAAVNYFVTIYSAKRLIAYEGNAMAAANCGSFRKANRVDPNCHVDPNCALTKFDLFNNHILKILAPGKFYNDLTSRCLS